MLDVAVGTARAATVRGLIHHVVVVERRYADRLLGDPVSGYDSGFDAVDAGGLAAARAQEPGGPLFNRLAPAAELRAILAARRAAAG